MVGWGVLLAAWEEVCDEGDGDGDGGGLDCVDGGSGFGKGFVWEGCCAGFVGA